MKRILLSLAFILTAAALAACSMDTTGGFNHNNYTMNGKPIYDPGGLPF